MKLINLTQDKQAIVDEKDYEYLNQWKWFYGGGYAKRAIYINGKQRIIWMHRFIMDTPEGKEVDHINGNGLDNRRVNLRNCFHIENGKNKRLQKNSSSGYKGVTKYTVVKNGKTYDYWMAQIIHNKKRTCLGYFKTPEQAARTYDAVAKEMHGKYANINL